MTFSGSYFAEATARSPQIDFNHITGDIILEGKSIPENAAKVYEPLLEHITKYVKSPRAVTNFRLNLEYFNSASVLWFARIVKTLGKIELDESLLLIHIYFDLEDYDTMNLDEIKDIVASLIDNIGQVKIGIGVKIYGTDNNHKIVKESTILT